MLNKIDIVDVLNTFLKTFISAYPFATKHFTAMQPSPQSSTVRIPTSSYLSHGEGPLLGEGVVVEVEDAQVCVVLHGFGQSRHARVVDAVLRHVNLLQAAHQLRTQRMIRTMTWPVWSGGQITNNMSYIDITWSEISNCNQSISAPGRQISTM